MLQVKVTAQNTKKIQLNQKKNPKETMNKIPKT